MRCKIIVKKTKSGKKTIRFAPFNVTMNNKVQNTCKNASEQFKTKLNLIIFSLKILKSFLNQKQKKEPKLV